MTAPLFSQIKNLGGTINDYGRVTSLGVDYVIVKDDGVNAGQFSAFGEGDTVLLIQMKGVRTYVTEDASYGTLEGNYGLPGQHEFLIVEKVETGPKKITFRNNISHPTFSAQGDLQIVKVPTYNAAKVNSNLTCAPWDSVKKTGGVLALIVGRTIVLNDSVDVTSKGFLGGATALGMGLCAVVDPKLYKYAYAATAGLDSAGFKGEGPVSRGFNASLTPHIYPGYAKGKGANMTSGGGGDGRFSGGGGGGNYGGGGTGGNEIGCIPNKGGGVGGWQLKGTFLGVDRRMFPGAGGGASTYIAGGTPTPGGNGGGMIFLIADTIKGNGNIIRADGAEAKKAFGNAGAGGGGGGGTVALYIQNYSNLTITARGGKGGDNAGTFGEGGGGGGGLITTNTPASSAGITRLYNGGLVGDRSGSETGTAGASGENLTTWVPLLNGFLFNSIRSSVTNTQVDSICSNVIPAPITGTLPVGGSGNYSYSWQKSYDLAALPSVIGGAISKDFTPAAAEADTFWIRRIVKDETTTLTDTSKWVQINVTPAITGNLVGKDTTICYNQDPLSLIALNAGPTKGNGKYQYQWLQNTDDLNWPTSANATGTSNISSYDPPALTATTFYQRKITSGRCVNYSTTVKITVLPSITGNITTRPDSVICEGSLFNVLGASAPGGGFAGDYDFQWQESTNLATWLPTSAADITATYAPDTSKFAVTEKIYFRRTVYSGPDSVCLNKSAPILLTRWHKIETNNISADQTICSSETPANLTGIQPTQGDHINYAYQWQDSSKAATWTTRSSVTANSAFAPPALTDTTWYRRIVTSSKCTNTSNKIVVNVHDPIVNNIVEADTTICNGSDPKKLRGKLPTGGNGLYAYQWYSSTDNFVANNLSISTSGTLKDYDPLSLSASTSYRREVISGACKTLSNKILVTVLPSISANTITPDKPEVCFNTLPNPITGSPLTGGAGGIPTWIWQDSTSGNMWSNIAGGTTQSFTHTANLIKQTWYRRIIRSGPADCCIDTSAVAVIDTLRLPTATITSVADTSICNGREVKLRVTLTGAKNWNLVYNENSTAVTENNISTGKYTITRVPSVGSSLQTFNYSLASLTDANGCAAVIAGLNGTRKANVYRVPVTEAGPDDEICGPVYTLKAVPSDGTGIWTFPAQVLSGNASLYNATVAVDSSFITANESYKFYWTELNGICAAKDSVTITFHNRIDPVDAGCGGDIMSFDNSTVVNATDLKSFETGLWSVEEGSGTFESSEMDSTYITDLSIGTNTFKWSVINGTCKLEDLITFVVSNPVIPELISPNSDGINDTLIIKGLDFVTQTIDLTILNGAGTKIFSTSNRNGNSDWVNWDGKNSKGAELPEGTYYYMLKVSSGKVEGHVSKKSGFIILKRR